MTDLDDLISRLRRDLYVGGLTREDALRLANESPKRGLNGVARKEPESDTWRVAVEGETERLRRTAVRRRRRA